MKQSSWTDGSVEIEPQHIVDDVHPAAGEDTHIETLVEPTGDLNTEEEEDKKHIEVILAEYSALLTQ